MLFILHENISLLYDHILRQLILLKNSLFINSALNKLIGHSENYVVTIKESDLSSGKRFFLSKANVKYGELSLYLMSVVLHWTRNYFT
jgi:hypothetical protein